MNRFRPYAWLCILTTLLLAAAGCPPETPPTTSVSSPTNQIIRVRLLESIGQADISATSNAQLGFGTALPQQELLFPRGTPIAVTHDATGWQIGASHWQDGVLTLAPGTGGTLAVNQSAYHGALRFVPTASGFDVINDVGIDDYLQGVIAREMYRDWNVEAYKAQAVAARTYAIYTAKTEGINRTWDVTNDIRSQVYGGITGETSNSRLAVAQTAGLVLTYGPGAGTIFQAYFSSDCGPVSASATDVFGLPPFPPLESHDMHGWGHLSPYANWGPVTIDKAELTRRARSWAAHRTPPRPEIALTAITQVDLTLVNPLGRPTQFKITDAGGAVYFLAAEEMRAIFNTDAPAGSTLPSSFCKVRSDSQTIVFYDGHGFGHGVGMSQWCAQEQALAGETFDQIVLFAYPQAKLEKAY